MMQTGADRVCTFDNAIVVSQYASGELLTSHTTSAEFYSMNAGVDSVRTLRSSFPSHIPFSLISARDRDWRTPLRKRP